MRDKWHHNHFVIVGTVLEMKDCNILFQIHFIILTMMSSMKLHLGFFIFI